MSLDKTILLFISLSIFIGLFGMWTVHVGNKNFEAIEQTYPDISIETNGCLERLKGSKKFIYYKGE